MSHFLVWCDDFVAAAGAWLSEKNQSYSLSIVHSRAVPVTETKFVYPSRLPSYTKAMTEEMNQVGRRKSYSETIRTLTQVLTTKTVKKLYNKLIFIVYTSSTLVHNEGSILQCTFISGNEHPVFQRIALEKTGDDVPQRYKVRNLLLWFFPSQMYIL